MGWGGRTDTLACPGCMRAYCGNDPTNAQSGFRKYVGQARVPVLLRTVKMIV
jgi:hypothetical protein